MSNSSIVTHYIGWGCHTPNSQETQFEMGILCSSWALCFRNIFLVIKETCLYRESFKITTIVPIQNSPAGPPSFYTVGTGSFNGAKWLAWGNNHSSPSSAEVKERVELYLYYSFVPSWQVTGWTLCLPYCPEVLGSIPHNPRQIYGKVALG
jgi:hypothetical protein